MSTMKTGAFDLSLHHQPRNLSDRLALGFVKMLRFVADTFFAKRYGHRAVVLETVAAVPGMDAVIQHHLRRSGNREPAMSLGYSRSHNTVTEPQADLRDPTIAPPKSDSFR